MRLLEKTRGRLARLRDRLEDALVASALAEGGCPEMARRERIEARRARECCGALDRGESCDREPERRCAPARRRAC